MKMLVEIFKGKSLIYFLRRDVSIIFIAVNSQNAI